MANAVIERVPGTDNLTVQRDGYSWRRIAGAWEMFSDRHGWFACEIQDPALRRQVNDFEYCLRTYTFDEGPAYVAGRKYGESIAAYVQRLQIAELRKGALNLFAPVPMNYTPGADRARKRAAELRKLSRPYSPDFRSHLTA